MTRSDVYRAWLKAASDDLDSDARAHRLRRPEALPAPTPTGGWRGAATRVDVSRELFVDPAGWSTRADAGTGWLGHSFARLGLLEDPAGARVLFVNLDGLAGYRYVTERLGEALVGLGLDAGRVFVTATHAHTAAGDTFGDCFYDSFANSPWRGFDPVAARWLVLRLASAAAGLVAALAPAQLFAADVRLPRGLLWNRGISAYLAVAGNPPDLSPAARLAASDRGHPAGWEPNPQDTSVAAAALRAVDPVVQLFGWTHGDPLGFAIAAIHGTPAALAPHLDLLGSDAFGFAAARLEAGGGVVALAAGAHGDSNLVAGPDVAGLLACKQASNGGLLQRRRVAHRLAAAIGDALANALAAGLAAKLPLDAAGLELWYADAFAPGGQVAADPLDQPAGAAAMPAGPRQLSAEWGFGPATTGGSEFSKPDAPSAQELVKLASREPVDWAETRLRNNVLVALTGVAWGRPKEFVYPPFVPLRVVRIGEVALLGVPVEPTVRLGDRLRAAVAAHGAERVLVLGNVGGFTGYADTVAGYQVAEYEGASTYWGRDFGPWLVQQVARLAGRTTWTVAGGVPAADAWERGGRLPAGVAVGGDAFFSFARQLETGAGKASPGVENTRRYAGFVGVRDPLPAGVPALTSGVAVAGWWRPARRAVRRARPDRSWPHLANHGPVVVIDLAGGGRVRSDLHPMLVYWDRDDQCWRFEAELPSKPALFRVAGNHPDVQPVGSPTVLYQGP